MNDSGMRLRSVRLKPAAFLGDTLTNVINGLGSTADPRSANLYLFQPLAPQQINAAYRGSGLMRKVIDIPAFDMVREWRDWQAEADQITKLEAEERRLGLRPKIMLAEIMRGLGGGAIILGAPGDLSTAVRPSANGTLAYAHVVSRYALTANEWVDDLADPLFGGPKYWTVQADARQQRIHPSRVVCFRGDPVPNLDGSDFETEFWGESKVQRVLDAVQDADTARAGFASLIAKARNTIIGIPGLSDLVATTEGEGRLRRRIAAMMAGESIFNATLRDAGDGKEGSGETIDHRQVTWAGIPDIIRVFAEAVSAAADIPMTRLWGKAAEGMNSSGDSQQRDWTKMVRARQELTLRPCMEAIDALLIPSALGGGAPADVWWQFAPLDTPSEAEEATRFKSTMEAIEKLQNTGAIPDQAFAKATQNTIVEGGWMPGLEGALAEIPEEERFGLENVEPPEAANENAVEEMQKAGAINEDQARALLTDAAPRTLYVRRDVVNGAEIKAWATGQGISDLADDLHVTIVYSRQPLDWIKAGNASDWGDKDGRLTIPPGGPRVVEPLGDMTAVLLFASSELGWRHLSIIEAGASHDYEGYIPHISLTKEELSGDGIEPYRGKIVLGPEIFEEIDEGRA